MAEKCKASGHDYYWFACCNEDGWRCVDCGDNPGEPEGFSPKLDRELIEIKVYCLLNDLADNQLVSVSNATAADYLTADVADQCRKLGRYDQQTILKLIIEADAGSHAKFWQEISEGILSGNDKRDRCHCGKLATLHAGKKHFCPEHSAEGYKDFFAD